MSGVHVLSPCLYSLRHGGASHDALTQERTVEQVKVRGRWGSDKSLLRYRKESRAQLEVQKLGSGCQDLGRWMQANLEAVFNEPLLTQHALMRFLPAAGPSPRSKAGASRRSRHVLTRSASPP